MKYIKEIQNTDALRAIPANPQVSPDATKRQKMRERGYLDGTDQSNSNNSNSVLKKIRNRVGRFAVSMGNSTDELVRIVNRLTLPRPVTNALYILAGLSLSIYIFGVSKPLDDAYVQIRKNTEGMSAKDRIALICGKEQTEQVYGSLRCTLSSASVETTSKIQNAVQGIVRNAAPGVANFFWGDGQTSRDGPPPTQTPAIPQGKANPETADTDANANIKRVLQNIGKYYSGIDKTIPLKDLLPVGQISETRTISGTTVTIQVGMRLFEFTGTKLPDSGAGESSEAVAYALQKFTNNITNPTYRVSYWNGDIVQNPDYIVTKLKEEYPGLNLDPRKLEDAIKKIKIN